MSDEKSFELMRRLEAKAALAELMQWLERNTEWRSLRVVDGLVCGVDDYLTTRGLAVGLNYESYERRYCYQDRGEADAALAAYSDTDQHPGGLWIKVKGTFRGAPIDALNPSWPDLHPWDEVAPP